MVIIGMSFNHLSAALPFACLTSLCRLPLHFLIELDPAFRTRRVIVSNSIAHEISKIYDTPGRARPVEVERIKILDKIVQAQ
jgi:hypothetical protein